MNTDAEAPETQAWQKALLPLMTKVLVGLTLFFFAASGIQLVHLHWRISQSPDLNLDTVLKDTANGPHRLSNSRDLFLRGLFYLENNALARRYHHASVLLMSRIWTTYLSFVTGMVLCVVGASFILGKLAVAETTIEGETPGLSVSLKSSSPGIILATLGTVLITVSFFSHRQISVTDAALFVPSEVKTQSTARPSLLTEDLLDRVLNTPVIDEKAGEPGESEDSNTPGDAVEEDHSMESLFSPP